MYNMKDNKIRSLLSKYVISDFNISWRHLNYTTCMLSTISVIRSIVFLIDEAFVDICIVVMYARCRLTRNLM